METKTKSGVGVVIARFQVAELTEGHKHLLSTVYDRHNSVLVLLGCNGTNSSTSNNPLDFEARRLMVNAFMPDATVVGINDSNCDTQWSSDVDKAISVNTSISSKAYLYGGRDSFVHYYKGRHDVVEIDSIVGYSGTESRKDIADGTSKSSVCFRKGAIWATQNRYPTAYPVVDVAILNDNADTILLGKKPGEKLWRLPGGFVDPKSGFSENALENTVVREVAEETSLEIADIKYVGSFFVEDWRYDSEPDCIMSVLFMAKYVFGVPTAGDDLEEVKWFDLTSETLNQIGPKSHIKMFEKVLETIGDQNG